jgi:putative Mg2+ transporter-C (MgtC) family protein
MEFLINALIVSIIAGVIGNERANSGKAIGFRSIALVMLGAYVFTYLSTGENGVLDYHVIAQIVTGISFVGAGLIFKDNDVHNLTTAILVWTMASVGVLMGLDKIIEAIVISVLIFLILSYKKRNT